ncbi:uncharacterized protein LOC132389591 [Hypanus sabinus]|uniref:uncharacterized protein LOC132389591 n=1 Tax=Hypanus sabinus TaxID=79690 RepID=UPI0028C4489F|nr:uncharacterized protein LOC132389591 [Hypanus sabinus]
MDEGKTYVNVRFAETDAQSPSNDGLISTYAELNFSKAEPLIAEFEDHRNVSHPGEQTITAPTAAQERKSKVKIGNRPYRLICRLCLIVIVVGLSIHVSQIRQSKVTSDRNYHDLNSTLQSKLSALNANLSVIERMQSDLHHHFTEMETNSLLNTVPDPQQTPPEETNGGLATYRLQQIDQLQNGEGAEVVGLRLGQMCTRPVVAQIHFFPQLSAADVPVAKYEFIRRKIVNSLLPPNAAVSYDLAEDDM